MMTLHAARTGRGVRQSQHDHGRKTGQWALPRDGSSRSAIVDREQGELVAGLEVNGDFKLEVLQLVRVDVDLENRLLDPGAKPGQDPGHAAAPAVVADIVTGDEEGHDRDGCAEES